MTINSGSVYYVYAYIDPFGRQPFYIGKGKGMRAYQHLCPCYLKRNTHFHNKLRHMLAKGAKPEIVFLYKNLSEQQAFEIEEIFISTYGRRDVGTGCLCNHTNGGEGSSGAKLSKATKQRMSKTRKGIKYSKETKQRMSIVQQKRKRTDKELQRLLKYSEKRRNPVESYDLATGVTAQQFESLCAAGRAGFTLSSIHRTVKGKQKKHKGLGWRYTDENK